MSRPSLLLALALVLPACGSGSGSPPSGSSDPAGSGVTTSGVATATATSTVNPVLLQMQKDALACKFEQGFFARDCPALEKWKSNGFHGKEVDTAVFEMLFDPDEKVRVLAATRMDLFGPWILEDKDDAKRLLDRIPNEPVATLRSSLAREAGKLAIEKLGFEDALRALAKSSDENTRQGLAAGLLTSRTPLRVELTGALLTDVAARVRQEASYSLSSAGTSLSTEGRETIPLICKVIGDALGGPATMDAVFAGAPQRDCPGLPERLLGLMEERTKQLTTMADGDGHTFALSLGMICETYPTAPKTPIALKKKAFTLLDRLASTPGTSLRSGTRKTAVEGLAKCDATAARSKLESLAKDKSEEVARAAQEALANLQKPQK